MNPMLLVRGVQTAKKGLIALNEYRAKKADEAYDALQDAAQAALDKGQELYDSAADAVDNADVDGRVKDLNKRGSAISKQAAKRLEKAKAQTGDLRKEAEKNAKKSGKQLRKMAKQREKDAKKAAKDAKKKFKKDKKSSGSKKFGIIATVLALLSAVAAAVYYFLFREDEKVSTVPPRVEDFATTDSSDEPKLVYSTETPQDADLGGTEKPFDEKVADSLDPTVDTPGVGEFDNDAEMDSWADERSSSTQAHDILAAEVEAKYGDTDKK
ncbi:hypothetical protein CCICO_00080 [Corynebacterium ciconiae DSM 44920]|uniref:hypothetical protein n=1 Tax=Corynebacterium ciconiae TaxID=227319 RepID=UPI00037E675E|nr:hypothetical protein [Corynebacterium ciconiae]WKD60080.1 hypothetical protein CCICO_00080 [Corynebacterium ciconiae DSM 44920]